LHKKLDEIELFSKQNWELALKKLVDHNNMFQNYSDDLSQKMAKNAQFSGGSLLWVMATKLGSSLSIATTQCAIPTILEVAGYTA